MAVSAADQFSRLVLSWAHGTGGCTVLFHVVYGFAVIWHCAQFPLEKLGAAWIRFNGCNSLTDIDFVLYSARFECFWLVWSKRHGDAHWHTVYLSWFSHHCNELAGESFIVVNQVKTDLLYAVNFYVQFVVADILRQSDVVSGHEIRVG